MAYQLLRICLTRADGIITPEDLSQLQLPKGINSTQGVVIEGRGLIWLYAYLTHECHANAWVGCYDLGLGGAVVVESHSSEFSVGEVFKIQLP